MAPGEPGHRSAVNQQRRANGGRNCRRATDPLPARAQGRAAGDIVQGGVHKVRRVKPPGQGVGAWTDTIRAGALPSSSTGAAPWGHWFHDVLDQPSCAASRSCHLAGLADGGIPYRVRVGLLVAPRASTGWGGAPASTARGLERRPGPGACGGNGCPIGTHGTGCHGALPGVGALNSRKSTTYSARLGRHIIVRRTGPWGHSFQRVFLAFQAIAPDRSRGAVPHCG